MLPLETGPARDLLARGPELLEHLAAEPRATLRWYCSTSTAVVLGRGQGPAQAAGGLEVLRRASGGGAVLLSPDMLCLDVVVPAGHRLLAGSVSSVFLPVGRAWASALREVGVADVEVYEGPARARRRGTPRERFLAGVCFATLGRGEVTAGGRKLVGLSQRRRRAGALVQCGLLRRWSPEPLLEALSGDGHDPEITCAAVGLDALGVVADDREVMRRVSAQLAGMVTGDV